MKGYETETIFANFVKILWSLSPWKIAQIKKQMDNNIKFMNLFKCIQKIKEI